MTKTRRKKYFKQLQEGIEVEKEHRYTYNKVKLMCKRKKFPSRKSFYSSIARDHITKEGIDYYPALERMEKRLKNKNKNRKRKSILKDMFGQ